MEQPEGGIIPGNEHLICKLKRNMYGLKQASRCWNDCFHTFMVSKGFIPNKFDNCVYVFNKNKRWVSILIYADDILIVDRTNDNAEWGITILIDEFKLRDFGNADYYLGVRITRDRSARTISLSQKHYINELLEKFDLVYSKCANTPMDENANFWNISDLAEVNDCDAYDSVQYRKIIGLLLYLVNWTRLDIGNTMITLG